MSLLMLGAMLAYCSAGARGQEGSPWLPRSTDLPRAVAPSSDPNQEMLQRLRMMEQRLDRVATHNDILMRENATLAERVQDLARQVSDPARQGTASSGAPAAGEDGTGAPGAAGSASPGSAGGGARTSGGGDPTSIGRAQEVGNLHLGQVPLKSYYDFDNGGFHVVTPDEEYTLVIRGMTQLDGMVYDKPTPGAATSGFYNPRSRIYFEGNATKPIQYEFSFQSFYDTVALLDAYVNFNFDPRFQVQLGRYKTPFTYEFYRIHVWDLLAPERSLFATNYEANRRFGLMAHGDLLDQCLEYAVGTFDTQRNSFRPFDNLQDVEAFLNFKPFYNREEGFLLRDIHFGGSVDAGNENQSPVPSVLRTNKSPGGDTVDSTVASNAASVPFLAFNPGVLEHGSRALWELHTAYYCGGLSLLGAWQSGHESYSNGATGARNQIPIEGWFVQAGYILTGETIRDRTLIQPLHPFDLRPCRFGLGAWEPTARFSELSLDSRVFTDGLANPNLWTNHAKLLDVGMNWYLNQFVKVYFDWEHAMFGSPVMSNSGGFRNSSDLFWVRTQLYF
jgi:phosphate-selective porin OprO/OprP